jgi:hypothetical protein
MSPDELHAAMLANLERRKRHALRMARHHRDLATKATAAGETEMASTLRLLAANLEAAAALAEAERRDREACHAKAMRATKNVELAQRERPGRRPAMRELLRDHLGPLKRSGLQFKVLLKRWENERIGPLRLYDLGDGRYRIVDEDADAAPVEYTARYLEKLYSKAR